MAKYFFEKSSIFHHSDALNYLGDLYYYGYGVKQDYLKAKYYYQRSELLENSDACVKLGNMYLRGLGIEQNFQQSRYYYDESSKLKNSDAFNNLGNLYFHGIAVNKDYLRAKYYYEVSSKSKNSNAFYKLGDLYFYGYGVKQDYLKAKYYYEQSSYLNNSNASNNLGNMYAIGEGVKQNYNISKYYYEKSSLLDNSYSYFILGEFYSNINIDIAKSIEYFMKSIQKSSEQVFVSNESNKSLLIFYETNNYKYISYNSLGLIYLTVLMDIKNAENYLKESAFAEYPFGQNNFGLFNQFYLNKIDDAKYMYKRSSKHNFPLAEFNLGRLYELKNKIEKSIIFYVKASDHLNEILIFRDTIYNDKRLEISKLFIICLTNLKLAKYYFTKSDYDLSKKYFIRSINILENTTFCSYKFEFTFKKETLYKNQNKVFLYLKRFIFNFPPFNLNNQTHLIFNQNDDQGPFEMDKKNENHYKKENDDESN